MTSKTDFTPISFEALTVETGMPAASCKGSSPHDSVSDVAHSALTHQSAPETGARPPTWRFEPTGTATENRRFQPSLTARAKAAPSTPRAKSPKGAPPPSPSPSDFRTPSVSASSVSCETPIGSPSEKMGPSTPKPDRIAQARAVQDRKLAGGTTTACARVASASPLHSSPLDSLIFSRRASPLASTSPSSYSPWTPRHIKIDHIIGLARPGYVAHNKADPAGKGSAEMEIGSREQSEMRQTINYLYDTEGVRHLVSFSDHAYTLSRLPTIMDLWGEKTGFTENLDPITKKRLPNGFTSIVTADFDEKGGVTATKIQKFLEITRSGEVTAAFCGAGQGRTHTYLAAYIMHKYKVDSSTAISILERAYGSKADFEGTKRQIINYNSRVLIQFHRKLSEK